MYLIIIILRYSHVRIKSGPSSEGTLWWISIIFVGIPSMVGTPTQPPLRFSLPSSPSPKSVNLFTYLGLDTYTLTPPYVRKRKMTTRTSPRTSVIHQPNSEVRIVSRTVYHSGVMYKQLSFFLTYSLTYKKTQCSE